MNAPPVGVPILPYDDDAWMSSSARSALPIGVPPRTKDASEVLAKFRGAYDSNNVTTDALRSMSERARQADVGAMMASSGTILPINGSYASAAKADDAWDCSPMGQASMCIDRERTYKDRLGRTVHVYASCMPPAQKDYGIERGDERLRKSQGRHAIEKSKREMSNADVPLSRNDPIGLNISRLTEEAGASTRLNRQHAQEDGVDWGRSDFYDGYNLKHGHETRARRIDKTQRSKHERNTLLGLNSKNQIAERLPVHGSAIPRRSLGLGATETSNLNARMPVADLQYRPPIVLSEATPRALPGVGVIATALDSHGRARPLRDLGRGPTRRPDVADVRRVADFGVAGGVAQPGERRAAAHPAPRKVENPLVRVQGGMSAQSATAGTRSHPTPTTGHRDALAQGALPHPLITEAVARPISGEVRVRDGDAASLSEQHTAAQHGPSLPPEPSHVRVAATDSRSMPDSQPSDSVLEHDPVRGATLLHGHDSLIQEQRYDRSRDIGRAQQAAPSIKAGDDVQLGDPASRWSSESRAAPSHGAQTIKAGDDTMLDGKSHGEAAASVEASKWQSGDDQVHLHPEIADAFASDAMAPQLAATALSEYRPSTYTVHDDALPNAQSNNAAAASGGVDGANVARHEARDALSPAGGVDETDRTALYESLSMDEQPVSKVWLAEHAARINSDLRGSALDLGDMHLVSIMTPSTHTMPAQQGRVSTRGVDVAEAAPTIPASFAFRPVLPVLTPESLHNQRRPHSR